MVKGGTHQSIIAKRRSGSVEDVSAPGGSDTAPLKQPVEPAGESDTEAAGLIELKASGAEGERLDRFLATRLSQYSRTRLQRWIELGAVSWDDQILDRRYRLSGVETLTIEPQPLEADGAFEPEPVDFPVVHEDRDILVIDKPAGLVVHPAAGNWHGTLLNGLLHAFPAQAALPRAGIVHRLDKDTSGLLVIARTERAMNSLARQLADRSMGRRYLALVHGEPEQRGEVQAPIGRDPVQRIRMAIVHGPSGREARTLFRVLARGSVNGRPVAAVECRLHTGRTHQIRVHMRHLGHPIVGDSIYGGASVGSLGRQALHAWRLALLHPDGGQESVWTSAVARDLEGALLDAGIDVEAMMHAAGRRFDG